MLTALAALFSTGGIGSLFGVIGGLANRYMDERRARLDAEIRRDDRVHELAMRDKDIEYMKSEYASKLQIATREGEDAIEVAGYNAMQSSYQTQRETGIRWVDSVASLVRPVLTVFFVIITCWIYYKVSATVSAHSISGAQAYELWAQVTEWILFQAGVCVGWWFAMRPGKAPTLRK